MKIKIERFEQMFCNRVKAEGSRSACIIPVLSWVFEDGGDLQDFVFIKTKQIVTFIPHSTFDSRKDSTDSKKLHSRKLSLDGRRDRSAYASLIIKYA